MSEDVVVFSHGKESGPWGTKIMALADIARADPDTEVLLRVDAAVPYGRVAALIGQVQAAGLSRIGFVAERER